MDSNVYYMDRNISNIVRLINIPKFSGKTAQERYEEHAQKAQRAEAIGDHTVAQNHYQQAEYYRRIMNHPNHCIAGDREEPLHPTITRLEQLVAGMAKYITNKKAEMRAAKAANATQTEVDAPGEMDTNGLEDGAEPQEVDGNLGQHTGEPCKIIPFTPRPRGEENKPD
jgi:hypothetical protein